MCLQWCVESFASKRREAPLDTSKLSLGDQIAAASGIALFIFMFLPWYGASVSTNITGAGGISVSDTANAWQSFGFIDIVLFIVAVVAIGVPVAKATGSLPEDVPGAMIVLAAGALGVLLVLYRILDVPGPDVSSFGGVDVDFGRKIGIFLGLVATAGIAYGGWRANEESPVSSTPAPTPPPPAAPEPPAATS
jgi:hypothetical protein